MDKIEETLATESILSSLIVVFVSFLDKYEKAKGKDAAEFCYNANVALSKINDELEDLRG